jgi:hypothetical protein
MGGQSAAFSYRKAPQRVTLNAAILGGAKNLFFGHAGACVPAYFPRVFFA